MFTYRMESYGNDGYGGFSCYRVLAKEISSSKEIEVKRYKFDDLASKTKAYGDAVTYASIMNSSV